MSTTTPNINLVKPAGTEKYDLDIVNANSDIIDTQITDAKAGSNLRIFKVKNDLTDQDNAVSRVSGDGRYIRISTSITAFIYLNYTHATDAVAKFNQLGTGKIASFLQNSIEKSYVANDGNVWVGGKRLVNTDELQAVEDTSIANAMPIGTMIDFAGNTAPLGYLVCNGGVVSQTTYANLYAVLGVLWANTAGASTPEVGEFRLPPQQVDGLGLFNRGVGATNGVVGTYESDVIRNITGTGHTDGARFTTSSFGAIEIGPTITGTARSTATTTASTTGFNFDASLNVPTGVENRPKTITVLKCIKY